MTLVALTMGVTAFANDSMVPIASPDLVFDEKDGVVAVEAEHFYKQTLTDKRAWHISTSKHVPEIKPDADRAHVAGASNGAYVEILPDTRATHGHKMVYEENFTDKPGALTIAHYKVNIKTPGRYYVWVRSFSTGSEDNGVHVGINGQWPESGQRWQTVEKGKWAWDCKQRTEQVHIGVPMQLFLDIEKEGEHEIQFSLREDGFEMDKFVLARNKTFTPEGQGPAVRVKAGQMPATFPEVAAPAPVVMNLDKDAAAKPSGNGVTMEAASFALAGSGYYLDKGKWLAINPDKNKTAQAKQAFPFPSGRYDVTLEAVGEEDGMSTYTVTINGQQIGAHACPLAQTPMEEGAQYHATWRNQQVDAGAIIAVSSAVASAGGLEYSRARWARICFTPADDATKAAVKVAPVTPASTLVPVVVLAPLVLPRKADGKGSVEITGELKQWHKVTLTLDGPYAHELDNEPNPFTDYNLTVTFKHESGSPCYKVPGYFAGDGNAGNSSAEAGTKWRAHLSPDKAGSWSYDVSFTRGKHAALEGGGKPVAPFDGVSGPFTIAKTDKTGRDFRAHGRLQYVGKHYLQFVGSKEYFLKAGPDAPETLMAYTEFDNTIAGKGDKVPLKTWSPHVGDWKPGDPTWRDGKGRGLIGALNYLAGKGVNAFSFLTYNAAGDGDNVWPFAERNAKLHYDCSKLDQWGVVFDHATALGLYLHFKMQENEMDDDRVGHDSKSGRVSESLDGGKLGIERKLYCRELIARFGHALALNWNIGEENTQSSDEVRDMAKYLHDTDPYQHHIVLHTFPNQQDKVYQPLLGDKSLLTGVSLQNSWKAVHQLTLQWLRASAAASRPWVVANDEQNPAGLGVPPDPGYKGYDGIAKEKQPKGSKAEGNFKANPYTLHDIRKLTLWGNLMAGGAGVEYYFGYALPENDLVAQDFRSRDKSWDYCRIALEFFRKEKIPLTEMTSSNALIGNTKDDNSKFCLAKTGEVYLVYLPNGGTSDLDLSASKGAFTLKWFNPRTGGELVNGSVNTVNGGASVALGNPPADATEDWLVVIQR